MNPIAAEAGQFQAVDVGNVLCGKTTLPAFRVEGEVCLNCQEFLTHSSLVTLETLSSMASSLNLMFVAAPDAMMKHLEENNYKYMGSLWMPVSHLRLMCCCLTGKMQQNDMQSDSFIAQIAKGDFSFSTLQVPASDDGQLVSWSGSSTSNPVLTRHCTDLCPSATGTHGDADTAEFTCIASRTSFAERMDVESRDNCITFSHGAASRNILNTVTEFSAYSDDERRETHSLVERGFLSSFCQSEHTLQSVVTTVSDTTLEREEFSVIECQPLFSLDAGDRTYDPPPLCTPHMLESMKAKLLTDRNHKQLQNLVVPGLTNGPQQPAAALSVASTRFCATELASTSKLDSVLSIPQRSKSHIESGAAGQDLFSTHTQQVSPSDIFQCCIEGERGGENRLEDHAKISEPMFGESSGQLSGDPLLCSAGFCCLGCDIDEKPLTLRTRKLDDTSSSETPLVCSSRLCPRDAASSASDSAVLSAGGTVENDCTVALDDDDFIDTVSLMKLVGLATSPLPDDILDLDACLGRHTDAPVYEDMLMDLDEDRTVEMDTETEQPPCREERPLGSCEMTDLIEHCAALDDIHLMLDDLGMAELDASAVHVLSEQKQASPDGGQGISQLPYLAQSESMSTPSPCDNESQYSTTAASELFSAQIVDHAVHESTWVHTEETSTPSSSYNTVSVDVDPVTQTDTCSNYCSDLTSPSAPDKEISAEEKKICNQSSPFAFSVAPSGVDITPHVKTADTSCMEKQPPVSMIIERIAALVRPSAAKEKSTHKKKKCRQKRNGKSSLQIVRKLLVKSMDPILMKEEGGKVQFTLRPQPGFHRILRKAGLAVDDPGCTELLHLVGCLLSTAVQWNK